MLLRWHTHFQPQWREHCRWDEHHHHVWHQRGHHLLYHRWQHPRMLHGQGVVLRWHALQQRDQQDLGDERAAMESDCVQVHKC